MENAFLSVKSDSVSSGKSRNRKFLETDYFCFDANNLVQEKETNSSDNSVIAELYESRIKQLEEKIEEQNEELIELTQKKNEELIRLNEELSRVNKELNRAKQEISRINFDSQLKKIKRNYEDK